MSSISSLPGSSDLLSVFQQLNAQDTTNSTTSLSTISDGSDPSESTSTTASSGHHHHHHGVSNKIESAVTSALQNAQPGEDPNQVIQNAIASALKNANGADPNNPNASSTDSSSTTASSIASNTQSDGTSQSDFESLLKSFNIDPQQFKQDFQTAVQNVQQGGGVDFSTLFQSFPPGSAVNTVG